jgi:hypothetical protein
MRVGLEDSFGATPQKESKKEIAKRLKITRLALGHDTQVAFCKALGVAPQRWNPVSLTASLR